MSQIAEIEQAWYALLCDAAARHGSYGGTVTAGTPRSLVAPADGHPAGEDALAWAVLEMTSGVNAGRWRVVTQSRVVDGVITMQWHEALPSAVSEGDTYAVHYAPLGGATVFLRRVPSGSMRPSELPSVYVASQRIRQVVPQATGRMQGSRRATLEVRTDLLSAWDGTAQSERVAYQLCEQVDQLRLTLTSLPGVAKIATPTREETLVGFGELDAGQRIYWSTLWTPFVYHV